MTKRTLKKQTGFLSLELMAVIGVIAIIAAGVLKFLPDITKSADKQELVKQHRLMMKSISDFMNPIFTGVTTTAVVDGKIVPVPMRRGSGADAFIQPVYGSAQVAILPDSAREDLFAAQYTGMPSENCSGDVAALSAEALRVEIGADVGSLTIIKDLMADPQVPLNKVAMAGACGGFSTSYVVKFTQR